VRWTALHGYRSIVQEEGAKELHRLYVYSRNVVVSNLMEGHCSFMPSLPQVLAHKPPSGNEEHVDRDKQPGKHLVAKLYHKESKDDSAKWRFLLLACSPPVLGVVRLGTQIVYLHQDPGSDAAP
jgi:hypothetical protein